MSIFNQLKLVRLEEGGFMVMNGEREYATAIYGATTIDEALAFMKSKLNPDEGGSCSRCHGKKIDR